MEKLTVGYPFSGRFLLADGWQMYITLLTTAIPVNSTSKFRESFKATAYNLHVCTVHEQYVTLVSN
jgi:hypothetical protein